MNKNPRLLGWEPIHVKHMRCTLAPIIMEMENGALEDEFSLRKVIVGKILSYTDNSTRAFCGL